MRLNAEEEHPFTLPSDPVEFARRVLGFNPTPYQENLLRDQSKRIVVRMARQAGKTTTIAVRAIWFAATHPRTLTLIVAPSMRQSMIMMDRIHGFLTGLPADIRRSLVLKLQRTVVWFRNGSQVVALPCSIHLLRGYTANMIVCFPAGTMIKLADGRDVPIEKIRVGDKVLSVNEKGIIEAKTVRRVFRREWTGPLCRIQLEDRTLICTPNHKIYTTQGKIEAECLNEASRVIVLSERAQRQTPLIHSRTIPLWRAFRRLFAFKNKTETEKLNPPNTAFLKTSRVRSVEIFFNQGICQNPSQETKKRRMGERAYSFYDACLSLLHGSLQNLLHKRKENNKFIMAIKNNLQSRMSQEVFNLEVEDNHNYFANGILVANCDEAAFFRDDETIFYSVLYPMLSTTDGALIASSTPWGRDSVFYRMCSDPGFSKHVVTWRDVVEAGLVKPEFIDEMRRVLPPERFRREFEAQFVEDEDNYLPQDLIAKCIDPDLEYLDFESYPEGEFYAGVDFGKKHDYSVVAVVKRDGDELKVVHCHRFPLDEPYASVIGYVKTLCKRWKSIVSVHADQSGVGEYVVEDMEGAGIPVTGVILTARRKMEILGYMKQQMLNGALKIPYDPELISELNVEKFNITKDGLIVFSHPENSHDDRLWALALAVWASQTKPVEAWRGKSLL